MYRREAFVRGLRAVGFDVILQPPAPNVRPGDALLIWNRYGQYHDFANVAQKAGASVIVAENAYVGIDRENRRRYALANGGHNGSGAWPVGGPERWDALGIELKAWRTEGDHILVAPNRSFGMPGFIMPPNWAESLVTRLRARTKRPIKVRPHPGNGPPKTPLIDDMRGAWAVVIWSSSVGCEALIEGIPVICESPWWIAKGAALRSLNDLETAELPDRLPALRRLAWAQWTVEEIESGVPFQYLFDRPLSFG